MIFCFKDLLNICPVEVFSLEYWEDLLAKHEPDWSEYQDEGNDFIEASKQFFTDQRNLAQSIITIENFREKICEELQKKLLNPITLEKRNSDFSKKMMEIIRTVDADECYYMLSADEIDEFEQNGY